MALVVCSTSATASLLPSSSPFSSSSSITAIPTNFLSNTWCSSSPFSFSKLQIKPIALPAKSFHGIRIQSPLINNRKASLVVKASSEIDGAGSAENSEPPSENKEAVSVDKLPLESKLQERMEQKIRMKLAKKIRLRRKRLVRKRKLRKKGRWPPSKMKKLKNV